MYYGMDFETFGTRDIKTRGLDNYVSDPAFSALICSIAYLADGRPRTTTFDFVQRPQDLDTFKLFLWEQRNQATFAAHNAGFERTVLRRIGAPRVAVIDTAVISRCEGGSSRLEQAAPQLLGSQKMAVGKRLIDKFCKGTRPTAESVKDDPDWPLLTQYCEQDAILALLFALKFTDYSESSKEARYEQLTANMNDVGWHVDYELVKAMQERYLMNCDEAKLDFQQRYDPEGTFNVGSLKQLKEWCAARGVRATSFDAEHVERMINAVLKKLQTTPDGKQADDLAAVFDLLVLKQTLGGSSLSKLPVILRLTGEDNRLRNQYMHCGAGQTRRTTGVGVQMQNLKRLSTIRDMDTIYDPNVVWTNDDLAENLRQVFTATDKDGELIVGDFSSIESRALAYLAGEDWKLKAYHKGLDLYKVQAQKIYKIEYDEITKEQRSIGKVGELSCGYGAGGLAVAEFAKGMHVDLSEAGACTLVSDWREANPKILSLWDRLNAGLVAAAGGTFHSIQLTNVLYVDFCPSDTPASLLEQHPGAQSVKMKLTMDSECLMERVFHGCYQRGRNVCYYKPSDRATGPVWKNSYIHPKSKQRKFYSLYGGKLAGILVQSFCREMFFAALMRTQRAFFNTGVQIVGQFHDEIVLDWNPQRTHMDRDTAINELEYVMTHQSMFPGFPLAAEIKSAYRYIK